MNLKTAARRLGVHYQTAYRWVRSGQLVAVKVGAGYEISDAALGRFQAQRDAIEREPDVIRRLDGAQHPRVIDDDVTDQRCAAQAAALRALEDMVLCTTVDATAVYQRAAHALATLIGDAVIVSRCADGGSLSVEAFDHRDPERAVTMGAMLRFGGPDGPMYARRAAESGEAVFVSQVPQREVRTQVRPEFHQSLTTAGFYSAISAPIIGAGTVRGSVLVSRDAPGHPHTPEDRDFVVAVAARVGAAMVQAERGEASWELRARLTEELAGRVGPGELDLVREWLTDEVSDTEPVAVVNLDMSVDAATSAFAAHFGTTASDLKERAVNDLICPAHALEETFAQLHAGEFDYCTISTRPAVPALPAVVLDGAIIRLPDATPCCVLYVAHDVPAVAGS